MPRPRKSKETSARQRKFYCDDEAWKLIQMNARISGKSLSAYLRDSSSLQPRERVIAPDHLKMMMEISDRLVNSSTVLSHSHLPNSELLQILFLIEELEKNIAKLLPRYSMQPSTREGHSE